MRGKFKLLLLTLIFPALVLASEECTTAIISGMASSTGSPLLWKNRDTGHIYNKVVFVRETPYSYLALVNHDETSGRSAFAGINSAGFAIINSVAYNLPKKEGERTDLEGIIMADALRKCRTVDDFERYIRDNLGPGLGSLANFGVVDAAGGAALFEVHNHGYRRYDAVDFPEKYIINTNFSRSGLPYRGYGYLRFERALYLLKGAKKISPLYILQFVDRDVGNPLLKVPPMEKWGLLPADKPFWVYTNDSIDRSSTASAVVFQEAKKGKDPSLSTMWVILGEPLTSVAVPLWVKAGRVPRLLWDGDIAPLDREAMRIKSLLRPLKGGNRKKYLDLTKLNNRNGTGWLDLLLKTEREIFRETERFLSQEHSPRELFEFERKMAEKTYETLRRIH